MSETNVPEPEPQEPPSTQKGEATAQAQGGLPPAVNLGCGGLALLIAVGGMLMLVVRAVIDAVSPGELPVMVRESWIGVSIGIGFWLLIGWVIFRRGLAQREAGMGLAAGTGSMLRRIVTWTIGTILAMFLIALLREIVR